MPIEIKMPALSPTMEEGTLAKWLVKAGDTVKSGDLLAEIETDKATMEFEAVDEGVVASIDVAEGTDGVKVGTVIATIAMEGESYSPLPSKSSGPVDAPHQPEAAGGSFTRNWAGGGSAANTAPAATHPPAPSPGREGEQSATSASAVQPPSPPAVAPATASPSPGGRGGARVNASPLARRIAAEKGIDLSGITGTGPNGRIVKGDVEGEKLAAPGPQVSQPAATAPTSTEPKAVWFDDSIPHSAEKLSNIRKTIARRLTEAKQTIPHIYLTVDVRLDALLKLRGELNASLEPRGIKLSVNDLLIKALGVALVQVPTCNVTFAGDTLISYERADVSVAVSTPSGLITPIIRDAAGTSVSSIATAMKELAGRARDNKLKPEEYQGGTASLSNLGMFGIKQFEAVINPPQGMILAIGAGEPRPYVVDGALSVATVMSATGSFDHRAIDGADGAELMRVFKQLVDAPLGLLA